MSGPIVERLEARQAQRPAARGAGARRHAVAPPRRSRAMWSGVVPQQPPTMLTQARLGELAQQRARCRSGVSS
jgi:hypothetical protein